MHKMLDNKIVGIPSRELSAVSYNLLTQLQDLETLTLEQHTAGAADRSIQLIWNSENS